MGFDDLVRVIDCVSVDHHQLQATRQFKDTLHFVLHLHCGAGTVSNYLTLQLKLT